MYEQGFKRCIEMGQRWEVKEEGEQLRTIAAKQTAENDGGIIINLQ